MYKELINIEMYSVIKDHPYVEDFFFIHGIKGL